MAQSKYWAQSKYYYPGTEILINKLNIRDKQELQRAERNLTTIRLAELQFQPITGNFDLKHLKKIHKYIFQDIYDFAGKLRNERIAKRNFEFAQPKYLEDNFNEIHKKLKKENYLKGLGKEQMSDKLAYYMAEINVLHPFREGNGRSTREFIRCLALSNGYTLEWSKLNKEELLNASIRSVNDHSLLAKQIEKAIIENEPSKEVMKQWEFLKKQELER